MFNDVMNVAAADDQRRKALQRLAQQLQANSARSSALGAVGGLGSLGVGQGLGNQQRALLRPLAMANMGSLQRFYPGGRPDYGAAINHFGIVARQPGARDPGAIPDLGGAPASVGTTAPPGGPTGTGTVVPPGVGGGPAAPGYFQQQTSQDSSNNTQAALNEHLSLVGQQGPAAATPAPAPAPTGYVNYQGTPIPLALFKAMQLGLGA